MNYFVKASILIKEYLIRFKRKRIIRSRLKFQRLNLIKLGNDYGGYYLPSEIFNILNDDIIVLSFGIGEDLSFSEGIVNNFKAIIYAFDPTPRSEIYVSNHYLSKNNSFHFFNYGLSDGNKKQVFYMPKIKEFVSCSTHKQNWVGEDSIEVNMHTFDWIINELNIKKVDILKMDIEGSEFDVIEQIFSCGIPIKVICMEIHDYLFTDGTANNKLKYISSLINNNGYILVNLSKSCNEMTLINKKYLNNK